MRLLRVAIIGSGPAGMYAAQHLLTQRDVAVSIDLFERLPTPWGLVRAGVAPDHPEKKLIADRLFRQLFARPELRYFGNIEVGRDVQLHELQQLYSAVIVASGASGDVPLGIAGESLPGAFSAREFVAWYNGHPDVRRFSVDLSCRRAVIIGNGNVALDAARILTTPVAVLERSDIADHALAALRRSQVEEVVILGRRGRAQAAFNTPELEELLHLPGVEVSIEGDDGDDVAALSWIQQRKLAILQQMQQRPSGGVGKRIRLCFFSAPQALLGDGRVQALRLRKTRLERGADGSERLLADGEAQTLETGLVLRAIGYRGEPFAGLPFDQAKGVIANRDGRIVDGDQPLPGFYCTGWIKRGPRGIIGSNKKCAGATVAALLADLDSGALVHKPPGEGTIDALLTMRDARVVDVEGWLRIDRAERRAGRAQGRPRVKFTEVAAMLEAGGDMRARS